MISKYNNFLTEQILESINESYLYYTDGFRDILSRMKKNRIASDILDSKGTDLKGDMTFIDTSDKEGNISFSQIKKGISVISKWSKENGFVDSEGNLNREVAGIVDRINRGRFDFDSYRFSNDLLTKSRNDVKIGKMINSLFPGKYTAQEVEEFVNRFKRYSSGVDETTFSIVEGDDIKETYLHSNYVSESGTLGNSCMRYSNCQNYFKIYTDNPEVCRVLVLKNEDGEILGRVLIWKITNIDDEELKTAEYFMDRIYTYNDSIVNDFKDYADKNGWIRRTNTGYSDTKTLTYKDTVYNGVQMEVKLSKYKDIDEFPYMDTFKRLDTNTGILYNDSKNVEGSYTLEDTDGGYQANEGVWSEYYDCYIPEDDAVYSDPLDSYIYSESSINVTIGRHRGMYPDGYDYLSFDEYRDEYIHQDDSMYCEYEDVTFYENDAVEVITEFNDESDFEHEKFSEMCDNIVEAKEMQCYSYLYNNDLEEFYFHKDILGSNLYDNGPENNGYYLKKFEIKVYKTNLGNYTKVDCDILGIKDITEFDKKGDPNNFMSDTFSYNWKLSNKKELISKCKEKVDYYKSILYGNQSRFDFEDEDEFRNNSKNMLDYFSERYNELVDL